MEHSTISKTTGFDYLIKEVGEELMPVADGYTEVKLYDTILFEDAFSINDVTEALIKVLNKKIGTTINEIYKQKVVNLPAPVYKPQLELFNNKKRIALFDNKGKKITVSRSIEMDNPITFLFQNIEYIQKEKNGNIYYRRV